MASDHADSTRRRMAIVLLIDADVDAAAMYKFGLESAGFQVVERHEARDLSAELDVHPDVGVTQWEYLGVAPSDFVSRLKSIDETHHVPIIVLTNDVEVERHSREAEAAGARLWLVKVDTPPSLLASRVAEVLAT